MPASLVSRDVGQRLGLDRIAWLAVFAAIACVLVVARNLSPSASGMGTHTQLGLPACTFLLLTSLPCPACGLTTSFAFMARGELAAALAANAFGVLLFAIGVVALPSTAWASWKRLPLYDTCLRLRLGRCVLILTAIALLHWITRVTFLLMH